MAIAALDSLASEMSKRWSKELRKIVSGPIEFQPMFGGILGIFRTKDDVPIVVYQAQETFIDRSRVGEEGKTLQLFTRCYYATVVDKPIPTTVIAKNIGTVLAKRVFILFLGPDQYSVYRTDAKGIYKKKTIWNSFVELLNKDKGLRGLVTRYLNSEGTLTLETAVTFTRQATFKIDDSKRTYQTLCQLVPMGSMTFVVLQSITVPYIIHFPRQRVEILRKLSAHILNYDYQQPATKLIADPWPPIINKVLLCARSQTYEQIQETANKRGTTILELLKELISGL